MQHVTSRCHTARSYIRARDERARRPMVVEVHLRLVGVVHHRREHLRARREEGVKVHDRHSAHLRAHRADGARARDTAVRVQDRRRGGFGRHIDTHRLIFPMGRCRPARLSTTLQREHATHTYALRCRITYADRSRRARYSNNR
jgi:hypothetical protein